jgi:tetrahydromethanopterin S-methyltransferase subunit A
MTTQELTRKCGEIEQRVTSHDEKIINLAEKVESVETEQKEQRRLLVAVERLAVNMEIVKEKVEDVCGRMLRIEEKPAKRWETFVGQVIGLLIAAALGYVLSQLGVQA